MPEKVQNPGTANSFCGKVAELRECINSAQSILILTHDYPDPDCIASAYGLSHLCSYWGSPTPVISFGGFIGRAENRALVRFLDISMVPFALIDVAEFDRILLVDSYPGKGNISLPPTAVVSGVIDHHPAPPENPLSCFTDIRKEVGATSTLITKYLQEAGCPIPRQLATALFYGIKTDTGDMRRDVSTFDLDCYKYLFEHIDHKLLSLIVNPDRDIEYFRLLHRATETAVSYNSIGYTHLGNVSTPDYVAEMADLFHSLESIEWMICSGIFKTQIFFSIRSKNEYTSGMKAEQLACGLGGSGGGHGRAAAGRIQFSPEETANKKLEEFEVFIKKLFDVNAVKPKKIVQ
jgi:nanoRNase/pAp phosphatase (c-di-AMP/oligoRNAs hydrolase)